MMNSLGIIQNNSGITDLVKFLKESKTQYKTLKKEEERRIVEEYVEKALDENGNEILDTSDKLYSLYMQDGYDIVVEKGKTRKATEEEIKWIKENLYLRCRKVLKWKKSQSDFCNLMVMHNIRFVFNITKKYCKDTRDFDNMVSRGLYGLVKAANLFDPFSPTTEPDSEGREIEYLNKNGKPCHEDCKIVKFDEDGKTIPIKFCTYARNWIFKHVVEEFQDKTIKYIDNYSKSLNEFVKIGNHGDSKHTIENFVDDMVSPSYNKPKTITEELSSGESKGFYEGISEYLNNTNELTSLEKKIIIETYYNGRKSSEIAEETNNSYQVIALGKTNALKKLKKFMSNKYGVRSMNDI